METIDWREADRQLRRISKSKAALDAEELRWLRIAQSSELHVHLGYGSLLEYVERVLGYKPKVARERLHLAGVLEALPRLEKALATGTLPYSAVREIGRVVTVDTETEWLEATHGKTVGQIEEMVSGRPRGSLPGDPPDPTLRPKTLTFEVTPATLALLRDTQRRLEEELGHALIDDEVIGEMCRAVLAPGRDEGRATHQIAVSVCESCDRATQDGAGKAIPISKATLDLARCDAQHLGRVDGDSPPRATQDIPPLIRRAVMRRHHGQCVVPGCRASRYLHIHHINWRVVGGDHSPSNLVPICGAHHRALHDDRLRLLGTAPAALVFQHHDGRPYGSPPHAGCPAPTP